MSTLDGLRRAVTQVKAAIVPGDPERAERLRYIELLSTLSDKELEEAY
jgi:hypothetical protein